MDHSIPTIYQHVQTIPSAAWTITHNLKLYPVVDVYVDHLGSKEKILASEITYVDLNTCLVTFTAPFAGFATVS